MSEDRPHRRSHTFVKKGYQAKFILKFCLLVALGGGISTGLLFFFSRGTLTTSFDQSRLVIENTSFAILPAAVYTNLITLILISMACIAVVLFISHKIAGPLYRFEKDLGEIEGGDLTRQIRLRKDDQLKEFAESLNHMTSCLRGKVEGIGREMELVLESASKQDTPKSVLDELNRLRLMVSESFKI